jgi:hypothetical protein
MNSDQDFEALRKLMALKRHEQPPPEYLSELSTRIITRIEHGEGRANLWDRLSANLSLRPSVAYAFGLTVCGALGLSAVYMVRQEVTQTADSTTGTILKRPASANLFADQFKTVTPPLHVASWMGNTNPTADTEPQLSLFNSTYATIPVSYDMGAGRQ